MKFNDFIEKLYSAGWADNTDAQHSNIEKLWREMYPVVAELEDELIEIKGERL